MTAVRLLGVVAALGFFLLAARAGTRRRRISRLSLIIVA